MGNRKIFLLSNILVIVAGLVYFLFYGVNEGKTQDVNKLAANNLVNDSRFDHAPDYSWVSGQLHYNSLEGGCWSIKFSDNQEDENSYWGIFGLEFADPRMVNKLKDGSFVTIRGRVKGEKFSMACPQYIFTVISIEDKKSLPETPPIGGPPQSIFDKLKIFLNGVLDSVRNFLKGVKPTETKTKYNY